jgi:hypothetical protein
MTESNSWIVHGLECDDGHKLPPTELVRLIDLQEERKSSLALMRLLSDERHKSERLVAAANEVLRVYMSQFNGCLVALAFAVSNATDRTPV